MRALWLALLRALLRSGILQGGAVLAAGFVLGALLVDVFDPACSFAILVCATIAFWGGYIIGANAEQRRYRAAIERVFGRRRVR